MPVRPFAPALEPDAQRNQEQAREERPGQTEKRQNADVGVLGLAAQRDGQQKQPEDGGGGDEHHARQADPVVGQVNERGQPAPAPVDRNCSESCSQSVSRSCAPVRAVPRECSLFLTLYAGQEGGVQRVDVGVENHRIEVPDHDGQRGQHGLVEVDRGGDIQPALGQQLASPGCWPTAAAR